MIATSVTFDVVFIAHISAAVATLIIFVTMRFAGVAVARGADAATQRLRFPERRNWAARFLHLVPLTGIFLTVSGTKSDSLGHAWVLVGLVCYVAAAGHLEARTLPEERALASVIASDASASPAQGRQFVRSVDTLLLLVAIAFVAMLVQF